MTLWAMLIVLLAMGFAFIVGVFLGVYLAISRAVDK